MEIKILSWNIWVDGYFDQIKEFLKKSGADVIGLQEVREHDLSRDTIKFMESLGYKKVFTPTIKDWGEKVSDGPAIFTIHKIVASKKIVLPGDGLHTAVQADIKIGDKTLHAFTTHLSHTHQKDSETQLQEAEELLKHIPSTMSVVMGDFNATPESITIRRVKEILRDTDSENQPTWSVYPEGCFACKPKNIDTRLDYIFTTKDIKTHSFKVGNSRGSDHLPITVITEI